MHQIIRKTVMSLLLVVLVAGCGAHRLHQAQEMYNQAAQIEAQASLEDGEATGDPLDVQALHQYRLARSLADEALDKHGRDLRADQLYGTALVLKALCEWRIAALDENVDSAAVREIVAGIGERAEAEEIALGTRDRVLLAALPGLTEHARGLREPDPQRAGALFESALETMENALTAVDPPADHPVRIYIRLAQLRTLRAWSHVAYDDPPPGMDEDRWDQLWIARYRKYRDRLESLRGANPRVEQLLRKMDFDFGVE